MEDIIITATEINNRSNRISRYSGAIPYAEKAKKIYESMGEEPLFADEIAAKTGFAPWEVVSSMTELELEDLVCLCAGKRYKKI